LLYSKSPLQKWITTLPAISPKIAQLLYTAGVAEATHLLILEGLVMNINVNKLALAIGITFTALAATPSYALLISTSSTSVKASTSNTVNGTTTTDTDGPANSATSESSYNWTKAYWGGTFVGNTKVSYATGDSTGSSELWSAGAGWQSEERFSNSPTFTLDAHASVLHSAVITNNTSVSQIIDFKYLIVAGGISIDYIGESPNSFANAGYSADIRVNGNSLWASNAQIGITGGSRTFTQGGTSLQGSLLNNDKIYEWDNFNGSLSLGYLAAGASLTLDYQLSTYVNQFWADVGYGLHPYAEISDPFDFNTNPLFAADNFTATPANTGNPTDVPEPAGTLLLGAGLAALAFRRRKERKTTI